MNANVTKQWLWCFKKTEAESILNQSLRFKTYKMYITANIHALSFKTLQKQKSTILLLRLRATADPAIKHKLYL